MPKNQANPLVWKATSTLRGSLFMLTFGVFFLGIFVIEPNKNAETWFGLISYVFWTVGALFGTIYGVRTRVECDETGVRWCDWRGIWRAAMWEEIRDFYTLTAKGSTHRVETPQGIFSFDAQGDGKTLAEIISTRAVNAPIREWEIKGERLCDQWPRRLVFFAPGLDSAARNAFLVLLAAWGLTIYLLWFRMPPRGAIPASTYLLAYAAPILLLPVLPFLFWLFFLVQARQARPFRDQSVEVSPSGIVFYGETRVEVSWSQIGAYHWRKRGKIRFLELQTEGISIEIPVSGFGLGALCRIIERFSGVAIIKSQEEESMAVVPVQTAPDETLIFSFNNLGFQTMSWLFCSMAIAMFSTPFLLRLADPQTPPRDEFGLYIFGVLLFLLSLGWIWFLRVARLCLTRDALEWRAPFFHRTVAWQNIESFGSTPSNLGWISLNGKRMNLSYLWIPIAQRSRLQAEIERRAFNAKGNWE